MSHLNKQLHSFVDISNYTKGFEIVSTQFGPDGRVYILLIDKVPERVRGCSRLPLLKRDVLTRYSF